MFCFLNFLACSSETSRSSEWGSLNALQPGLFGGLARLLSGDAALIVDPGSQAEAGSAPLPIYSTPPAEAWQPLTPEITVLDDLDAIAAHRESHLSGKL